MSDSNNISLTGLRPTFLWLDHTANLLHYEYLSMLETFHRQTDALNEGNMIVLRNEQRFTRILDEATHIVRQLVMLEEFARDISIGLQTLERMIDVLEMQQTVYIRLSGGAVDDRCKMYDKIVAIVNQLSRTFKDFSEEYTDYADDYRKASAGISALNAHLNILTTLEKNIATIEELRTSNQQLFDKITMRLAKNYLFT